MTIQGLLFISSPRVSRLRAGWFVNVSRQAFHNIDFIFLRGLIPIKITRSSFNIELPKWVR